MGACQDCWVLTGDGERMRACTTVLEPGMNLRTHDGAEIVSDAIRPLIVGAGPAGIRAAQVLVSAGIRPVVIDEAPSGGGQIYRQRLVPDERSAQDLYGSEAAKATALHDTFAADPRQDRLSVRETLVWNLRDKAADAVTGHRTRRIAFSHLILATGATDRVLPFPGWTLPGVFTLGGAQIALKSQGCAIGEQVVFLGSGPLLYLVAWQYVKAGANVAAVLDTAPFSAKLHLLRGLLAQPSVVLRGFRYAAELMARGVAVRFGVRAGPHRRRRRESRELSGASAARSIASPATRWVMASALRSETQLADLAGCRFVFDARDRAWRPERDGAGRTSMPGVYIAGDGAGIAGADAAELAGERAGLALLEDAGLPVDHARIGVLERKLASIRKFRDVLESAFPFPDGLGQQHRRRRDPVPLRGDRRRRCARCGARSGCFRTQSSEGVDAVSAWAGARDGCAEARRRKCWLPPAVSRRTRSDGCARSRPSSPFRCEIAAEGEAA